MDLPELGAVGFARVVSNEPCPKIEPSGPGQLITATFAHESAHVLDLTFAPTGTKSTDPRLVVKQSSHQLTAFDSSVGMRVVEQKLGVTAAHPFWSVTREDFVPAGELELFEQVVTIDGQVWRLTSITPRAGPEPVYNFEVSGEHVYYVGDGGLLVHNAYLNLAIRHAKGHIGSVLTVVNGAAKRTASRLSGDHVLPLHVFKDALNRAGASAMQRDSVMRIAHSSKNLRLMNSALNSSKWRLNAVQFAKTPLGSRLPRSYIQNILRKQYTNAQHINNLLGGNIDYFQHFFR